MLLNGSIAAVADLLYNGTVTIDEEVITSDYMFNHTLSEWIYKLSEESRDINFNTAINTTNIALKPYDAWGFIVYVNLTFNLSDENEMCFYENYNFSTFSISSIEGLEDLYCLLFSL